MIKFRIFGSTEVVFVSSHLAAHMKHNPHRNLNVQEIVNEARFGSNPAVDFDSQFHHCIWLGDLNYRVDLSTVPSRASEDLGEAGKENPKKWKATHDLVVAQDYNALLEGDQLRQAIAKHDAFTGFKEAPITFGPTFKVKRTAGTVHTEQRVPSYSDRVLYKSRPGYAGLLKPITYEGHPSITSSDHKPVSATFEMTCLPSRPKTTTTTITGPVIRITNLKGSKLLGLDVSGLSDVYGIFHSDLPIRTAKKGAQPRTVVMSNTINPVWPDNGIDEFMIQANTPSDLDYAHLFVVLMDYDLSSGDDRMGQVVLSLKEAAYSKGQAVPFAVDVTRGSSGAGTLSGNIQIIWPSEGENAAGFGPKARTDKSCCSVM